MWIFSLVRDDKNSAAQSISHNIFALHHMSLTNQKNMSKP